MKNVYSILILILFSTTAFSQTDSISEKKWILKWNATAALDIFSFPTVQFAVEKKISNYFSVQSELGVQLYQLNSLYSNSDTIHVKTGGFKANLEARFFPFSYFKRFEGRKYRLQPFIGIQTFYRHNKYNMADKYYYANENEILYRVSDHFGVSKKAWGGGLVVGFQKNFWQHYMFETYAQLGVIDREIKNIGRDTSIGNGLTNDDYGHYFGSDHEEDSRTNANFSIGFRLGYRF